MSALSKIIQTLDAWEGDTIFIAEAAVDAELEQIAGIGGSQLFPVGKLLGKRLVVIPDVFVASQNFNVRELIQHIRGDE